jgi:hypothetical protein
MSTRTRFSPFPVISAGNMSNDITSAVTVLQSISGVSYGISWTGSSPIGTLSLEVSNDYALEPNGTVKNAGTWAVVPLDVNGTTSDTIDVSGSTGNGFIDVDIMMAYAIRLIYSADSGSGTMTATIMGKVS